MNVLDLARLSSGLNQARRPIRLHLSYDDAILDDVLHIKRVYGQETLCGGFEYRLLCLSTEASLPLKEFLALPAELQFVTDRGLRNEWRSRFAVKPEWNQNGWVVEYEIRSGESLLVWRGPAASQKLEGTDYYLEGGSEQIVFFPSSRDEMVQALLRVDRDTGMPIMVSAGNEDRRVEFNDVTGAMAPAKLRARITDPRIKGPVETGWGATDYTSQEAQRILLTVPTAS